MAFHETIETGNTPGDGQGDGLRTNMRKLIENDNHLKMQLDAANGNNSGIISHASRHRIRPLDSTPFRFNGMGAIKIKLPQSISFNSTLRFSMHGTLDTYGLQKVANFTIGGQRNSGQLNWQNNVKALFLTNSISMNYTVRFGRDNQMNFLIYIGELNSLWYYTEFAISEILLWTGIPTQWVSGWEFSLETTMFENVSQTQTDNLPVQQ